MESAESASRRRPGAQMLLLYGSLLVASGLLFPWLVAGMAGAECGNHTCIPTGPVITTVSGWRLLAGSGAPSSHVMNYSYLALAPVFVGVILLGIATVGVIRPLPQLLVRVFTYLTIAGLLILGIETLVSVMNATSSDADVAAVLPALLVMFGGFILNVAGSVWLQRNPIHVDAQGGSTTTGTTS